MAVKQQWESCRIKLRNKIKEDSISPIHCFKDQGQTQNTQHNKRQTQTRHRMNTGKTKQTLMKTQAFRLLALDATRD